MWNRDIPKFIVGLTMIMQPIEMEWCDLVVWRHLSGLMDASGDSGNENVRFPAGGR